MKPKYPKCQNCGANDYEISKPDTVKCEYCGTEYEIEVPDNGECSHSECDHLFRPFPDRLYIAYPSTLATSYVTGTGVIEYK